MSSYHWSGAFVTLFLVAHVGLPLAAVILIGSYILLLNREPLKS